MFQESVVNVISVKEVLVTRPYSCCATTAGERLVALYATLKSDFLKNQLGKLVEKKTHFL